MVNFFKMLMIIILPLSHVNAMGNTQELPSYNVIDVNQEKLKQTFSCDDTTKISCFLNAQYIPDYGIYIFNFSLKVNDNNLKGLTINDYISNSMGPVLATINPKAAKYYNVKPIMRELIDESTYSVENAILGFSVTYKDEVYTGIEWIGLESVEGMEGVTMLTEKILKDNIEPYEYLINSCEKIKLAFTNLPKEQLYGYCDYGTE
ncbi:MULTISPECIES: hypothetical protein [Photobacterium]|uniref:hypothetical protein n=1 Tax=Photobacterium TaxID=657 RepID=UPI003D0C3851